ncbi:MAG: type IV pilus twitching motility protein PilT [Candidatus Ancaeobacter aquaticus]|nr:type IV pilus twitching motility protein PilT [Candidatus Ancaeobacter aquaticus]
MEMNNLLDYVCEKGASDLHLIVGTPPVVRIHGRLEYIGETPLNRGDTERLMKSITSEESVQKLLAKGNVDYGFAFENKGRFRVNVYKQKGTYALALRLIPARLMSLEEIGLPSHVKELLYKPRGLVLVTGPTGSGKTTTLASMINMINIERDTHIITVEDPIEYFHCHKKSIVSQREMGVDVLSFGDCLRAALREDPDVILVGEMRDLETMEAAITAAETGHLVFGTLHTTGAARTVDRIIDAFPINQQEQIRIQLASSLVAVISQILLPRSDNAGRIAAFEIMTSTPSIQNLIREKKTFRITSDIQTGTKHGMVTLDAFLLDLYNKKIISYSEMLSKAQDPEYIVSRAREESA